MSADSDTSILTDEYDEAISFGAIATTMAHLPGYDAEALQMMRLFQAWVNDGADPMMLSADDWGHRAEVRMQDFPTIEQSS